MLTEAFIVFLDTYINLAKYLQRVPLEVPVLLALSSSRYWKNVIQKY